MVCHGLPVLVCILPAGRGVGVQTVRERGYFRTVEGGGTASGTSPAANAASVGKKRRKRRKSEAKRQKERTKLARKWMARRWHWLCTRAGSPRVLCLVLRFLGRCFQLLHGDAGLRLRLNEVRRSARASAAEAAQGEARRLVGQASFVADVAAIGAASSGAEQVLTELEEVLSEPPPTGSSARVAAAAPTIVGAGQWTYAVDSVETALAEFAAASTLAVAEVDMQGSRGVVRDRGSSSSGSGSSSAAARLAGRPTSKQARGGLSRNEARQSEDQRAWVTPRAWADGVGLRSD